MKSKPVVGPTHLPVTLVALVVITTSAQAERYETPNVNRLPPVSVKNTGTPVSYVSNTTGEPAVSPTNGSYVYPTEQTSAPSNGESLVWARAGQSNHAYQGSIPQHSGYKPVGEGGTFRVGDEQPRVTDNKITKATTAEATAPITTSGVVTQSTVLEQGLTEANKSGVTGVGFHSACNCGVCDDCCTAPCCPPPCCKPTFWIAGVEATFLATDADGTGVSYLIEDTAAAPPLFESFGSDSTADLDDLFISPRLWLGIQRCNWGIVARYWHLRANSEAYDPFVFAPGGFEGLTDAGFSVLNQLDMYTTDIEGTYSFCCCNCKNTLSFGARYASSEHAAGLSSFADVDDGGGGTGLIIGRAYARNATTGTGLTGSWYGRKPLFPCSCVHLAGGLRGSVLWGSTDLIAETAVAEQTVGAGAASTNIAVLHQDETLFIGEVQLGLEWNYRVQCFPADAFFRVMAEYQYWTTGDDGAVVANSFAGFGPVPPGHVSLGTADASADSLDLDLYGFSIATGFNW